MQEPYRRRRVLRTVKFLNLNLNLNQLNRSYKIYKTPHDLAEAFALELINSIRKSAEKKSSFTIALSGGSTPEILYSVLAEKYGQCS